MSTNSHATNTDSSLVSHERAGRSVLGSAATRRTFLQGATLGAAALTVQRIASATEAVVDENGNVVQGFENIQKATSETSKGWKPVSDRKIRVGLVGYGFCKFGAAFGFQDHPNVEVVAVSDLIPERRDGLAKAARCAKTYDSLEELVKDDAIEAVFCATDPPHHAQHCMEVLKHGKHVAVNVPAVWGSLEQADQLYEAVNQARGLKYMMFETSYFYPTLWQMRQLYQAGAFGKHVASEGLYDHYHDGKEPMPSYLGWRDGPPPMWYGTHSTAFYVGVTGGTFTHVSGQGRVGTWSYLQPGVNKFNNTFASEYGFFRTSDGGTSLMGCSYDTVGHDGVKGKFRGDLGSYEGDMGDGVHNGSFDDKVYGVAKNQSLPSVTRPPLPPTVDPGGHGGAEGQLMNNFVNAILTDGAPIVGIADALNMTVPGIVAHQSALKEGELMKIPQYSEPA